MASPSTAEHHTKDSSPIWLVQTRTSTTLLALSWHASTPSERRQRCHRTGREKTFFRRFRPDGRPRIHERRRRRGCKPSQGGSAGSLRVAVRQRPSPWPATSYSSLKQLAHGTFVHDIGDMTVDRHRIGDMTCRQCRCRVRRGGFDLHVSIINSAPRQSGSSASKTLAWLRWVPTDPECDSTYAAPFWA
jgi:hypothetical protein